MNAARILAWYRNSFFRRFPSQPTNSIPGEDPLDVLWWRRVDRGNRSPNHFKNGWRIYGLVVTRRWAWQPVVYADGRYTGPLRLVWAGWEVVAFEPSPIRTISSADGQAIVDIRLRILCSPIVEATITGLDRPIWCPGVSDVRRAIDVVLGRAGPPTLGPSDPESPLHNARFRRVADRFLTPETVSDLAVAGVDAIERAIGLIGPLGPGFVRGLEPYDPVKAARDAHRRRAQSLDAEDLYLSDR